MLERAAPELLIRRKGNTDNDIGPAMQTLQGGNAGTQTELVARMTELVLNVTTQFYNSPPPRTAPHLEAKAP